MEDRSNSREKKDFWGSSVYLVEKFKLRGVEKWGGQLHGASEASEVRHAAVGQAKRCSSAVRYYLGEIISDVSLTARNFQW